MFEFRILLLIAYITIVNYFDRSAISYTILPLEQELGFSDAEFGMILGAFGIGYLPMSIFAGIILDRFGSIRTWTIGAAVWSICTLSFGFANGFWSMLFLRILLGISEGFHFPALVKTIGDWFHPHYRARALSVTLLGVPIASAIGAPFLTFLIRALSWRWMFIILGLLGMIWVLFWPLCFLDRKNPQLGVVSKTEQPETVWKIVKHLPFIGNSISYFAFGYMVFFSLLWLPGFLEKQDHVSIQNTGFLLVIPWIFSALFTVLGGFFSDLIWKRTHCYRKARSYLILGGLTLAAICFILVAFTNQVHAVIALLTLGLAFGFFTFSPINTLVGDLFPNRVATAQGIMTAFFGLAGIIAPSITGFLADSSGSFDSAFILLALVCAIGALASVTFHKKIAL